MIEIAITPKETDLGDGFIVRRSLPFAKKKMVGPFIFFDHLGPAKVNIDHGLKVRAHPHIGMSTLTYLFEGEIMHRDTLGNEQLIRPREVNWMTAGKGIAHSERSQVSGTDQVLEGLQIWIALPREIEDIEPNFVHINSSRIPVIQSGKNKFNLVAGKAFGKSSPVPVYSQLFCMEGKMEAEEIFAMDLAEDIEGAVYIVNGKLNCDHKIYESGSLICFKKGTSINFMALSGSQVIILGGEIFPEKRFIWWNFVSSSAAKIEIAKMRWENDQFGKVINEDECIPLPRDVSRPVEESVCYP
ncbi:MAG: pirin family protein [Bacteriovorax sp.]|jgi:hypothetical protein